MVTKTIVTLKEIMVTLYYGEHKLIDHNQKTRLNEI